MKFDVVTAVDVTLDACFVVCIIIIVLYSLDLNCLNVFENASIMLVGLVAPQTTKLTSSVALFTFIWRAFIVSAMFFRHSLLTLGAVHCY